MKRAKRITSHVASTGQAVLVANRGEIACRIIAACRAMGLRTVAVFSSDDPHSLHRHRADDAVELPKRGAAAFLDIADIVAAAIRAKVTMVHPGYGFLSESSAFAAACAEAGLSFIGPSPRALAVLGDKVAAHAAAAAAGVPTPRTSRHNSSVEDVQAFFKSTGDAADAAAIIIKAQHGGGGRGQAVCENFADIAPAHRRCASEALQAFGDGAVYAEEYLRNAKHVEIQIAADGAGGCVAFVERDCSVQRKRQKLVEFSPCLAITAATRAAMIRCAKNLCLALDYAGLCTIEFLLVVGGETEPTALQRFVFIEANPRLQVEHTVTEELFNVDLVRAQILLTAMRRRVADVFPASLLAGAASETPPGAQQGAASIFAMQLRVNMETILPDGSVRSTAGGVVTCFEVPAAGRSIRVDSFVYQGYNTAACNNFDSLLAKVIVRTDGAFEAHCRFAQAALRAFRIGGVVTNMALLDRILSHPVFVRGGATTTFLDTHLNSLLAVDPLASSPSQSLSLPVPLPLQSSSSSETSSSSSSSSPPPPEGAVAITCGMAASVVEVMVKEGQQVQAGDALVVVSAMKMEHVITADADGVVVGVLVAAGDAVVAGTTLLHLRSAVSSASSSRRDERGGGGGQEGEGGTVRRSGDGGVRPDLEEVLERKKFLQDAARGGKVAKRHSLGMKTARENVALLLDAAESFVEYGGLAVAAQRSRRSLEELIAETPADGLITGVGRVNGEAVAVAVYDFLVLAGTQGNRNHAKKDRLFELASTMRLPVVLYAEGGGGRPGDTDVTGVSGLDCLAFLLFARLNGVVPLVGVVAGKCFAGNAALLGCCDVVIACKGSNVGMGGPAMIEGGGLGVFRPEEIGPNGVQTRNGVIDIEVEDEVAAAAMARRWLDFFQHPVLGKSGGAAAAAAVEAGGDVRTLRDIVPENRLRVFDVRRVIEIVCDKEPGVVEVRRGFGQGMVCCLARIGGHAVAVVANNCQVMSGAITADCCDKAARFLQLAEAFDLPVVFLCDTPGFIVGPQEEEKALVRKAARLFIGGAALTVPFFTIVLRKSYGLGAQAMAGGSHKAPRYIASWPTGEMGGMGLEGAIKLGFRRELQAIEDLEERESTYKSLVEAAYHRGKALNVATLLEIDDVIDPADTRAVLIASLENAAACAAPVHYSKRKERKRTVDSW